MGVEEGPYSCGYGQLGGHSIDSPKLPFHSAHRERPRSPSSGPPHVHFQTAIIGIRLSDKVHYM